MANGTIAHHVPHQRKAQYAVAKTIVNQSNVSRMAGPFRRSSNLRISAFGTGVLYQVASDSPFASARSELSLLKTYRFSVSADIVYFPIVRLRSCLGHEFPIPMLPSWEAAGECRPSPADN